MYISEFIEKNKNRKILQYKKPETKIIYFVCEDNGEIIYIGRTSHLRRRLKQHGPRKDFQDKDIFYFVINNDENIKVLELKYIKEMRPKFNAFGLPCEKLGKPKVRTKYHVSKAKSKPKRKFYVKIASSKKEMKRLIRLCDGNRKKAADTANIALGYVYRLEKGLRPSLRLYGAIVRLCEELEAENVTKT